MPLHCLTVLALPRASVAPGWGGSAWRAGQGGAETWEHCPPGAAPQPPLTSSGGMPSGGRQGSTMPCSSDTSLARGSCSKFFRKSGGRTEASPWLSVSRWVSLAGPAEITAQARKKRPLPGGNVVGGWAASVSTLSSRQGRT